MGYEHILELLAIDVLVFLVVIRTGIVKSWELSKFSTDSLKTKGVVIDCYVAENSDHQSEYAGIVEFTFEGRTYVLYDTEFLMKRPEMGKQVSIHFHPDDPKDCIVNIHEKIKIELGVCLIWMTIIVGMNVAAFMQVFN